MTTESEFKERKKEREKEREKEENHKDHRVKKDLYGKRDFKNYDKKFLQKILKIEQNFLSLWLFLQKIDWSKQKAWTSGYGRRFMLKFQIPETFTRRMIWNIYLYDVEETENKQNRGRGWSVFTKT